MKKSIPRPRQVLLILVIVLTGSSFFPIDWARAISHHPRHLVSALARPVTYPVKLLADSIRRPVDLDIHQIEESLLRERYEMALQNIRRLEQQLMEAREQINTLGQVRQHLGLSGVRLYPASVIAWSNDPVHPTLQINRGTRHGLRIGLVVASGFNLVGRISDAGPVTSTVRLITGTQTQLTVRILPPRPGRPAPSAHRPAQILRRSGRFHSSDRCQRPGPNR